MLLGYILFLGIAFFFGVYVYGQVGQIMAKMQLVVIADDAKEELLELRRNEKNYIIRRDQVYLDKIHEIIGTLERRVVDVNSDIAGIFVDSDYAVLLDSVRAYSLLVDRFSQNYRITIIQAGKLKKISTEIEKKIVGTANYKLINEILELRLMQENFVILPENGSFSELKNKVRNFRSKIELDNKFVNLCDRYVDVLEDLAKHHDNELSLLVQIRDYANRMEKIIDRTAKRERENIAGYVVTSQHLLLGALLALALFGSLLTWFLSKAILSPLQKLETTVRRVSEGDFDLRLDLQGDVETVSLQKSFNTMLDTLNLSRESLERTVHLLQEKSIQLIESEKLASIGILASGVAHEINNPLANISLTAETIKETGKDLTDAELVELVGDILSQTDRATAVVANLLGYATSMKNSRTGDEDICAVVTQSITMVAHELKLHDIDLVQQIPVAPLMVKGNRGRLEQVFVNIMLNAVQAMDHKGVLSVTVRPDGNSAGNDAVIEIADTGPGITEENIKKIFDPFFTTKSAGEGTGLGLYVSYGIIQEHGGEIQVESTQGIGTLFRIRLPRSATEHVENR